MKIDKIVIHCSDSPQGRGDNAETIHRWHKEKGWDGIGYHAVILEDGTIEWGRPHYWTGAHAAGYNKNSVGICLIGRGGMTKQQERALHGLLEFYYLNAHPGAEVIGHNDLDPKKTCPGFNVKEWWNDR